MVGQADSEGKVRLAEGGECVCGFVSEPLSSDGNLRDRSDPQAATGDRQLNITHTPAWPHNCMYYVEVWWRFGGTVATSVVAGMGTVLR